MKIFFTAIISGLIFSVGVYTQEKKKPSDDLELFQGYWNCIHEEAKGKMMTKDQLREHKKSLKVEVNKFTMTRIDMGKVGSYDGKFFLNQKSEPKTFDFTGKGPGGTPLEFMGIYEISTDNLKLIYSRGPVGDKNLKRPKSFKTSGSDPFIYVQFKKEKDD